MKIKILLTFDHELPLGGLYKTYDDALFTPTYKIINLANKLDVKINLFTDILSAKFYKDNNESDFYFKYKEQIIHALNNEHDVQLHIHPHWIKSIYSDNKFIPSSYFKLADFKNEEYPNNIEGIIETSIQYLVKICNEGKNDYRCIAYRAGGFNLEPETERIMNSLYNNGIRIDSSIPKGYYYKSKNTLINYNDVPKECNWYISLKGHLNKPDTKGILEIPIATKPAGLYTNFTHIINKYLYKKRAYITGKSIHSGKVNLFDKLKFVFSVRALGFDIYSQNSDNLLNILDYNIKKYKEEDEIILCTLSHPKNMGDYAIKIMEEFIEKSRNKYKNIEFITYTKIIKQ